MRSFRRPARRSRRRTQPEASGEPGQQRIPISWTDVHQFDVMALLECVSYRMRSQVHRGYQRAALIEQPPNRTDERIGEKLHLSQLIDHHHAALTNRPAHRWERNPLERGHIHPVTAHPRTIRPRHMRDERSRATERLRGEPGPLPLLTHLTDDKAGHRDPGRLQKLSQAADERRLARPRRTSEKETRYRWGHASRMPAVSGPEPKFPYDGDTLVNIVASDRLREQQLSAIKQAWPSLMASIRRVLVPCASPADCALVGSQSPDVAGRSDLLLQAQRHRRRADALGAGAERAIMAWGTHTLDPMTDQLIGLRRLAVPPLSPAGFSVWSEMSGSGQRPRVLRDAFRAGRIPDGDLPELIAFAWTRDDEPTSDIGEAGWLEIFRHAGFFSYPPISGGRPTRAVTLYRGSTAERLRRMSWAAERSVAELLGRRHARNDAAAIYGAVVAPDAILAYLERSGEGWTVVVDPAGLTRIERLEAIPTLERIWEG